MASENVLLMQNAREALNGKWGLAIGTFLLYSIITSAGGAAFPPLSVVSLIIGGPFALGAAMFSLSVARGRATTLEQIFQGFNHFTNALVAYLLMILYVVLWSLLLIVPGVIAALSYSMTFYILADNPSLSGESALNKSKTMMDGYKLKFFYLCLRFFLWALLCVLTLGIGFLWLIPYVHVTTAKFYDDIKDKPVHA